MTQGMIVLGRLVGPYGLKGWLKLHPFGDDFDALGRMPKWWLGADAAGDAWTPYALHELRSQGKGWIVKFEGIDGRSAAEAMDGLYIAAPREALPKTEADEYYWADLIGLDVVNTSGEPLGKVSGLLSSGAHDVLCVQESLDGKTKERLLPFVAQVVKQVDRAGKTIHVEWGVDW